MAEALSPAAAWRGYVANPEVQGTNFDQGEARDGKNLAVELLFLSFFLLSSFPFHSETWWSD